MFLYIGGSGRFFSVVGYISPKKVKSVATNCLPLYGVNTGEEAKGPPLCWKGRVGRTQISLSVGLFLFQHF